MSLLESFARSGALLTIATTHHGELKTLKYRYIVACFSLLAHLLLEGNIIMIRLWFMIIVVSTHSYKFYVVIFLLSLSSIIRNVLLHQILDVILCLAVMVLLKMLAWSSMKRI